MSIVCDKKSSCLNLYKDTIVVLDTSALTHIIRAISPFTITRKNRFEAFVFIFEDFLIKIRLCSHGGVIYTTRKVFEEEMDPNNGSSAVHNCIASENICTNRNDLLQIREIIRNHIRIPSSAVSSSKIDEVRRLLRTRARRTAWYGRPNRNDLSLLVLGLEKTARQDTVILTDDTGLHRALGIIQRNRIATLSSQIIDTLKIKCTYSISYFEEPYKCCEVCSRDFYALYGVLFDYGKSINRNFNPSLLTRYLELLIIRVASEVIK